MKLRNSNKKISSSLDSTALGTAAEIASLPTLSSWKNAVSHCSQLNHDSSLLYFDNNNQQEFDFIIGLLRRLNFPNLVLPKQPTENSPFGTNKVSFEEEQKYFIGLTFNSRRLFFKNLIAHDRKILVNFPFKF